VSKLLTTILCMALLVPTAARATNQDAQISIHLASPAGSGCLLASSPPPCQVLDTSGGLGNYYAYLVLTNGDASTGIGGVQFGISYGSGITVWNWINCATLEFASPNWPASGSGNLVTWNLETQCQRIEPGGAGTGVVAVAGYFYMTAYSVGTIAVTPRPVDNIAKIADCNAQETSPLLSSALGFARFSTSGNEPGFNPCLGSLPPSGSCSISGPASIPAESTNQIFTATTDLPSPTYNWALSGSGAIVGSNSGPTVQVNGGPPGSFLLSVSILSGESGRSDCGSSIEVTTDGCTPLPCGPATVPANTTATYTAPAGYSYNWTVTNGLFLTPNTGQTVQIRVGNSGGMQIRLVLTNNSTGISSQIHRSITVTPSQGDPPDSQRDAKICLHVKSATSKNPCGDPLPSCDQVVTNGGLYPQTHNVFVLVSNGFTNGLSTSGVAGLQFGIEYDGAPQSGVDIYSWAPCADLEYPMSGWPSSGTGTLIIWDRFNHCQHQEPGGPGTGVAATAGYFYMAAYTPDILRITPRQVDGAAKVANCNSSESILVDETHNPSPSPLGTAGFGAPGYNPCTMVIPVLPTTWSQIKTLFD
jgi:hypothetical protein